MDYSRVFGLPSSVKAWIEALGLPQEIYDTLTALGYTTLLACAYLEQNDVQELKISLPGQVRTLLAGAAMLKSTLDRVKQKVVAQEDLQALELTRSDEPVASARRTPICNSAIPRGVAPDYWDRARDMSRFENRIRSADGIHLMLVRHAQSLANVDMKYYTTHSDYSIPLSEEGTHQAAETGRQIASYYRRKFNLTDDAPPPSDWLCRIWTSPYVRARQTSKLIMENADGWVTDIQENVLLVEQNFGLFEGMDWYSGELDDKYPDELHHYQKAAAFGGRFWAKIPLGESRFDVCLRVSQCFGTIHRDVSRCNIRNFLIVSHGTTLRAFMMMWLRLLPEWFEEEPNPSNASVRVIDDYQDEGYIWPPKARREEPTAVEAAHDDALLRTSGASAVAPSSPFKDSHVSSTIQSPRELAEAVAGVPIESEIRQIKIISPPSQQGDPISLPSSSGISGFDPHPLAQSQPFSHTAAQHYQHQAYHHTPFHSQHTHHTSHHTQQQSPRVPLQSPKSPSSNHSMLSYSGASVQYGGSEDALLRSSASIHPVTSLSRSQGPTHK